MARRSFSTGPHYVGRTHQVDLTQSITVRDRWGGGQDLEKLVGVAEVLFEGTVDIRPSERSGNNLKSFKAFSLKAKARIWP